MIGIEVETPWLSLQVNGVPKENLAKKFAPWKSDPELGMVIRDYVEVDEDGRMLTEVRRHDFGDVIPKVLRLDR